MRILAISLILFMSQNVLAATSSGQRWSLGLFGGIVTASQADLNTLITRANTRVGGISTPQFGNAYEFGAWIMRRFNNSVVALQLRPSYFMTSVSGTGTGGSFDYSLSGYVIQPQLVVYILESKSIKLFVQGGVGWGSLSGEIKEGAASAKFSGSNFGFTGGIGVNFCFGAKDQHCVVTEGNTRYYRIDRNTVSSSSGTFATGANPSVSQSGNGQELEIDNHDLATSMSGIQALLAYQYYF
jgi:hypothetical protein